MRFAAVLAVLVACGSPEDDEPVDGEEIVLDTDGKADGSTWTAVGLGVVYQQQNAGDAVLIAYGGYTARLVDSAAWATELVDEKLGALGVGHVYAVKGPADAAYAAREIGNSKLRAHLPASTARIYVVAHSSGAFVAHELLQQLTSRGATATLARIVYADLDGGTAGLTRGILDSLGDVTFVSARDPAVGRSHNGAFMASQAAGFGVQHFEVTVPGTGCVSSWCLHDVVITHRPHDPNNFDLARDYADFANRPVTTEYFDVFAPES